MGLLNSASFARDVPTAVLNSPTRSSSPLGAPRSCITAVLLASRNNLVVNASTCGRQSRAGFAISIKVSPVKRESLKRAFVRCFLPFGSRFVGSCWWENEELVARQRFEAYSAAVNLSNPEPCHDKFRVGCIFLFSRYCW